MREQEVRCFQLNVPKPCYSCNNFSALFNLDKYSIRHKRHVLQMVKNREYLFLLGTLVFGWMPQKRLCL